MGSFLRRGKPKGGLHVLCDRANCSSSKITMTTYNKKFRSSDPFHFLKCKKPPWRRLLNSNGRNFLMMSNLLSRIFILLIIVASQITFMKEKVTNIINVLVAQSWFLTFPMLVNGYLHVKEIITHNRTIYFRAVVPKTQISWRICGLQSVSIDN